MPQLAACPMCQTRYRLPDNVAGKRVKCQKCGEPFDVPLADDGVQSEPARRPAAAAPEARPSRRRDEDEDRPRRGSRADDDDDRPSRRRRVDDDEEDVDDDRPRRRRARDDDEDEDDFDRPRRRRKKAGSDSTALIIAGAAVGAVVLLGAIIGIIVWRVNANRPAQPIIAANPQPAPLPQPVPVMPNGMPPFMGGPQGGAGTTVVFGPDGSFQTGGNLTRQDPLRDGRPYKLYLVPMEQGKTYLIEMKASTPNFDSYLTLENPQGGLAMMDDDSGQGLDARIYFTAPAAGTYKLYAMSFVPAPIDGAFGGFSLSIRRDAPPPQIGPMGIPPMAGPQGAVPGGGTPIVLGPGGQAIQMAQLTRADPHMFGCACKVFLLNVERGKTYQIDESSPTLDSMLRLYDNNNRLLAQNDDFQPPSLDSRIQYTANDNGVVKIVASTLIPQTHGPVTITVRRIGG